MTEVYFTTNNKSRPRPPQARDVESVPLAVYAPVTADRFVIPGWIVPKLLLPATIRKGNL